MTSLLLCLVLAATQPGVTPTPLTTEKAMRTHFATHIRDFSMLLDLAQKEEHTGVFNVSGSEGGKFQALGIRAGATAIANNMPHSLTVISDNWGKQEARQFMSYRWMEKPPPEADVVKDGGLEPLIKGPPPDKMTEHFLHITDNWYVVLELHPPAK